MPLDPVLRAYLGTSDPHVQAGVMAEHPGMKELLASADQQRDVLAWLGTSEAAAADNALVANALSFAQQVATPDDAETIRPYTLDDDQRVRQAAYELLLGLYFPDINRPALLLVLQTMLTDESDHIRTMGASFVERAGAAAELAPYLRRWAGRQRSDTPAGEIVGRMLEDGGR